MTRLLTTSAALAAMLLACGKDEPKPAATPTPREPVKESTDKPLERSEDKTKEARPTGEVEPEPVKTGESDPKTPPPPPEKPADPVAPATPDEPPAMTAHPGALNPRSVATMPPQVVAVGGTPSLKALVDAFASQARRIEGAPVPAAPLETALQAAQQKLGIDLSWLAIDKPLRFAVPDPKKYPDGVVLLLPLEGELKASMLPGATAGGGHDMTVKLGSETMYFDKLVDGHVVVTKHDGLAKEVSGFVKELAAWTPKDPLVIDTSADNLVSIFGTELGEVKEMVQSMGSAMASRPEMAAKMGPMLEMADSGFALVEGASRIGLAVDPRGDFPRFAVALSGKPGSPLDEIAKDLTGRKVAMAGAVPADAWFAMGYDIEGLSYLSDADRIVDSLTTADMGPIKIEWTEGEKQQMKALLMKSQELQGSQGVAWIRQEGATPFIFESLSDTKDGAAMEKALLGLGELFYGKLWSQTRKMMVAQGAPEAQLPAAMPFKSFIAMMSQNLGAAGIGVAIDEATTKGGHAVSSLRVKIDWSRLPAGGAKEIGDLFGDEIGIALAGQGERFASVIGPKAAERAAGLLDAELAAPTGKWLQQVGDQAFFIMLRPARLMRALSGVVEELGEKKAMIDALPDEPIFVRGAGDGKSLRIEGTIPAKVMAALAGTFE